MHLKVLFDSPYVYFKILIEKAIFCKPNKPLSICFDHTLPPNFSYVGQIIGLMIGPYLKWTPYV